MEILHESTSISEIDKIGFVFIMMFHLLRNVYYTLPRLSRITRLLSPSRDAGYIVDRRLLVYKLGGDRNLYAQNK